MTDTDDETKPTATEHHILNVTRANPGDPGFDAELSDDDGRRIEYVWVIKEVHAANDPANTWLVRELKRLDEIDVEDGGDSDG